MAEVTILGLIRETYACSDTQVVICEDTRLL